MGDIGQGFEIMMRIMLVGGVMAGAAILGAPLAIYSYNKNESIQTIKQENNLPIIKTREHFRSDRVYVPIQTSTNIFEYIPMNKYLGSLEVLDKTKRATEETRLKKLLETN